MARLFKGKFLSGLKCLHEAGKLCYEGEASQYHSQYEYQVLLDICYRKNWVTDIRESFAGAETVMRYLGRYTHRIAISNSRILRMDGDTVTIRVKDYKNGGIWKELTLDGCEFVRRFLMCVPPKNFVRIRHYGLLSNHNKRNLIPICRNLIGCREFLRRFKKNDKVHAMKILYKNCHDMPVLWRHRIIRGMLWMGGSKKQRLIPKKQNRHMTKLGERGKYVIESPIA